MDLLPLAEAPAIIRIHVAAAAFALLLGTFVLFRRKGDALHMAIGRIWVMLMAALAFSAFFISEIRMFGPFSLLHLLAAFTLVMLGRAIWDIRRGNVHGHRTAMRSIYFGALFGAGIFTLLPGRVLHGVFSRDPGSWWPIAIAAAVAGIAAFVYLRWRRQIDRFGADRIERPSGRSRDVPDSGRATARPRTRAAPAATPPSHRDWRSARPPAAPRP
jgi:uncharacterized membrane protein